MSAKQESAEVMALSEGQSVQGEQLKGGRNFIF